MLRMLFRAVIPPLFLVGVIMPVAALTIGAATGLGTVGVYQEIGADPLQCLLLLGLFTLVGIAFAIARARAIETQEADRIDERLWQGMQHMVGPCVGVLGLWCFLLAVILGSDLARAENNKFLFDPTYRLPMIWPFPIASSAAWVTTWSVFAAGVCSILLLNWLGTLSRMNYERRTLGRLLGPVA